MAGLFKSSPGIEQGDDKNKVPKLVGMTLEEAEEACAEAGLVLAVVREEESEKYDKGYIFKQMTAQGVTLPEGTKVQVYVSTGIKVIPITIPDISNKTENEAITELVNAGFAKKNITVKTENHDTIEEDKATRTEPAAGEVGDKDSEIILYVSKGIGQTTMPKLVGKTKADAEKVLADAGLQGSVEEVNSEEPAGQVIAQETEEGTVLQRLTTVKYMVSAGKVKVQIPALSEMEGKTYTDVVKILEKLDVTIKKDTTASTKYNAGIVVDVDKAGQSVEEGSTVIIYVSDGPGPGTTEPTPPSNGQ